MEKKPTQHRPSAATPSDSEQQAEFKNSLASLLAKGNPLAPGVARKQTVVKSKKEEEEQKEKLKFDVFDDDESKLDKYK